MEIIKSVLFGVTFLVILFRILKQRYKHTLELRYLISSLMLTLLLLSVIVFKVHHFLRENYNIPDTFTYLFVFIVFIFHTFKFRHLILNSNFILLVLSITFLVGAVFLDLLTDGRILEFYYSDLTEEIMRILGAAFWLSYYSVKFSRS